MVWKLKERDLTLEEALEQAKVALSPYWFNSPPLIGVIKGADPSVFSLHPIDPQFLTKRWFLGFADPMTNDGESLIRLMVELNDRYGSLNLGFVLILKPALKSLSTTEAIQTFAKSLNVKFAYCLDVEETTFKVFGNPQRKPMFVILDQGKPVYRSPEGDPFASIEVSVQSFLRQTDPGLPLLPIIRDLSFLSRKKFEVGFGMGSTTGVFDPLLLDRPELFKKNGDSPFYQADFQKGGSGSHSVSTPGLVSLQGKWIRDDERIATNDPNAELTFVLRSSGFSVFAQSLAKKQEGSAVEVLINGLNIVDDFAGTDLKYDDEQTSFAQFGALRNYRLIKAIDPRSKILNLKFPTADKRPIAIYSIRESDD